MKKILILFTLSLAAAIFTPVINSFAYDFGDHRSVTLVGKAWGALAQGDLEATLAYTSKCLELYSQEAKKMQANLNDFPKGSNSEIFSYWALNDVATALFIQGEAYRKAGQKEDAKRAYQQAVDNFSYGQCWDPKGWFWKPAEASKEKIQMIDSGSEMDLSDSSSSGLTSKAWEYLGAKDVKAVNTIVEKCLTMYGDKAREMQASLTDYAWSSKDQVFSYWALNDVGTCLYIKGKAHQDAGEKEEAKKAYEMLIKEFKFAQCWDPGGWFWKPSEAAANELKNLN